MPAARLGAHSAPSPASWPPWAVQAFGFTLCGFGFRRLCPPTTCGDCWTDQRTATAVVPTDLYCWSSGFVTAGRLASDLIRRMGCGCTDRSRSQSAGGCARAYGIDEADRLRQRHDGAPPDTVSAGETAAGCQNCSFSTPRIDPIVTEVAGSALFAFTVRESALRALLRRRHPGRRFRRWQRVTSPTLGSGPKYPASGVLERRSRGCHCRTS